MRFVSLILKEGLSDVQFFLFVYTYPQFPGRNLSGDMFHVKHTRGYSPLLPGDRIPFQKSKHPFSKAEKRLHPSASALFQQAGDIRSSSQPPTPGRGFDFRANAMQKVNLRAEEASRSGRFRRPKYILPPAQPVEVQSKHPRKRADGGMYVGGLHICEPVSSAVCDKVAWL